MRHVRIKHLDIENFKGIRQFSMDFGDTTAVVGANGTGKTSLHDAYLWLLMGTDSSNRASFAVQPLDEKGGTIDHLTTIVNGTFVFDDGTEKVLKKCLSQTWTRRRGTKEDVLTGSETERFIDGVPMKAGEYDKAVAELFCSMADFELISSVKAFWKLDMKAKRAKLIQMAGQMPELINSEDYPNLAPYYAKNPNVDAIRAQLLYELKGMKDKKAEIPVRITENERDLPTGYDFDAIRGQIAEKQDEIDSIDAKLQRAADSRTGAYAALDPLNKEMMVINAELLEIRNSHAKERNDRIVALEKEVSSHGIELTAAESAIRTIERGLDDAKDRNAKLLFRKHELGELWERKNAETWPDTIETVCPTCNRPYDPDKVTEMRNAAIRAFNTGKSGVLARIESEGDDIVKKIEAVQKEILEGEAKLEDAWKKEEAAKKAKAEAQKKLADVPTLDSLLAASTEYQNVQAKKDALAARIKDETPQETAGELQMKNRKEQLKVEVSKLTRELALEDNIAKVEKRREELNAEEANIAADIAKVEGVLYEIQQYQKSYIELVESRVSSMFKYVTWKMYQKNVSNDGEQEICECLVNGVPVSTNVNTAGGVNAGVDIVNAISKWIGISVPLWIDGKESVSDLLPTDAQIITLSVVPGSELKVSAI
ncbi:MAG: AAA family ATPase [Bacteroidales bacterium]|nr:AAA family ATPase [Bacteroidales bacterium]